MTRRLLSLLALCLLLSALTGCSAEAKTGKAIDAIGAVTMASQEKIEYAQSLYEQLDEAQRAEISNAELLQQARAEFDRQSALITAAIEAVSAIDNAPGGLAAAVTAARQAFDAAEQLDVTGLLADAEASLLAAETRLQRMEEEADLLTSKLLELYAAGNYSGIELSAGPYIRDLPDGEAKRALCSVVVQAMCAQAEELYRQGKCMDAMTLLYRCEDYAGYCEDEAMAQSQSQMERYIREKAPSAPANGTVLDRTHHAGRNVFTVTAGSTDTCVKLELLEDPSKYVMLYVRANETAKVHLFNGTYRIKYATGPIWYDTTNLFGPEATYLALTEIVELAGYTTPTHIYWHSVSCTLHSGYDEELGIQNITPEEF